MERFEEYLKQLKTEKDLPPPVQILEDPVLSHGLDNAPNLEQRHFATKADAASYLLDKMAGMDQDGLLRDRGIWAWLSLYYFDEVCPLVDGKRRVKKPYYYIPSTHHQRRYRHLLATACEVATAIPKHNKMFLAKPVHVHGDTMEQLMGRLYLLRIPAVAEAMEILYFDHKRQKEKVGALSKTRRGNLRERFPIRLQQLSLTYDLNSMDGPQLVEALGKEFQGWLEGGSG